MGGVADGRTGPGGVWYSAGCGSIFLLLLLWALFLLLPLPTCTSGQSDACDVLAGAVGLHLSLLLAVGLCAGRGARGT